MAFPLHITEEWIQQELHLVEIDAAIASSFEFKVIIILLSSLRVTSSLWSYFLRI